MPKDPMPQPLVRLADVHVTLTSAAGPVKILQGVDLEVAAGSSVAVVGPSGSGKSTLLGVLGGIERPSQGLVEIDGQDLGALSEDQLATFRGQRIGILFQSFHLIPTMTAIENVAVPMELAGVAQAFERAEAGLATVGLAQRASHYPSQLSGGEQQRVALARALANRPKLLLADEPTGNLDQATGAEIADLLFATQRQQAVTLLLITHEPGLAARCERRMRMRDGLLQADPEPKPRLAALAGRDRPGEVA
jgi:putative ABC transport system ATP-binding protein